MANTEQDLETLVAQINDATNQVAAKLDAQAASIQALKNQIDAGTPVNQAQLDALASSLTAERDRLQTLGADPANPPLSRAATNARARDDTWAATGRETRSRERRRKRPSSVASWRGLRRGERTRHPQHFSNSVTVQRRTADMADHGRRGAR